LEEPLALIILIILLFIFFNPKVLPGIGTWLGGQSRKPVRQAKWVWSSFAGTEDEMIQAERDYGRECARVFAKQFISGSLQTDRELVENIGATLVKTAGDPRRKFDFAVVETAQANAFALPGGYIFITRSLLELCERERGEIAFLLGHEMGHVLRGHAKDRMTADTFLNAIMARLPAAGQMLRQVLSKGYSKVQELEADQEAVRLASAAGFNPQAAVSALKRLGQIVPDPSRLGEYFSSHPPISERIRALEKN
jgi:beta-barrel assembly-enhancing protease